MSTALILCWTHEVLYWLQEVEGEGKKQCVVIVTVCPVSGQNLNDRNAAICSTLESRPSWDIPLFYLQCFGAKSTPVIEDIWVKIDSDISNVQIYKGCHIRRNEKFSSHVHKISLGELKEEQGIVGKGNGVCGYLGSQIWKQMRKRESRAKNRKGQNDVRGY